MAIPQTAPTSSIKRVAAVLLHSIALATFLNAFRLLDKPGPMTDFMAKQYGGKWQFLTINGLAVSMLYMAVAIVKDLAPSLRALDPVQQVLGIVAVPMEGLISVLYWSIMSYDPSLMAPPGMRELFPLPLDLSMHAFPALFLWIDFLALSPPFSKAASPWLISGTLTTAYCCWMEWTAHHNGGYPYPFLNDMPTIPRLIFYAVSGGINVLLFHLANRIHFIVDHLLSRDVSRSKAQAAGKVE